MGASAEYFPEVRFWLLNPIPFYVNVWPFKTNHAAARGVFVSRQAVPSGVTLRMVVSGQWTLKMQGRSHTVSPGEIFCTMPSEAADFAQTDPDGAWEWHEIQFNGPEAEHFLAEFGLDARTPVIAPVHPRKALHLFRRLHEHLGSATRSETMVLALMFALVAACGHGAQGRHARKRRSSRKELVRNVKLVMEATPFVNRNISELTNQFRVERSTLYRAFMAETGMPPHVYMDTLRLARAMDLLVWTSLSLAEVALQTGFSDVKYFIGWFKSKTQQTPGHWRHAQPVHATPAPA